MTKTKSKTIRVRVEDELYQALEENRKRFEDWKDAELTQSVFLRGLLWKMSATLDKFFEDKVNSGTTAEADFNSI